MAALYANKNLLMLHEDASSDHKQQETTSVQRKISKNKQLRNSYEIQTAIESAEREFRQVDTFGEEELMKVTGAADLATVTELSLKVNTFDPSTTISELGVYLPHLTRLDLSGSLLQSFRDLGTSLRELTVLKLEDSGAKDLDGIGALGCLEKLYVKGNQLTDLTPLAMHESLVYLDVSRNELGDMNHVDQLGTCPRLSVLNLAGNPLCVANHYRKVVCYLIPTLEELDECTTTVSDKVAPSSSIITATLENTYNAVEENQVGNNSVTTELASVGDQLAIHEETADSMLEAFRMRQSREVTITMNGIDDGIEHRYTPLGRRIMAQQVQSEQFQNSVKDPTSSSYSSALTHGDNEVYAGNLASSIRRKKRAGKQQNLGDHQRGTDHILIEGKSVDDILEELQTWKSDLESNFATLQACKVELGEIPRTERKRVKQKISMKESLTSSSVSFEKPRAKKSSVTKSSSRRKSADSLYKDDVIGMEQTRRSGPEQVGSTSSLIHSNFPETQHECLDHNLLDSTTHRPSPRLTNRQSNPNQFEAYIGESSVGGGTDSLARKQFSSSEVCFRELSEFTMDLEDLELAPEGGEEVALSEQPKPPPKRHGTGTQPRSTHREYIEPSPLRSSFTKYVA